MHINYWREVKRDPFGRLGLALLLLILFLAFFAPLLAGHQPQAHTGPAFSPPAKGHPLGTNDVGQDVWAQLLYGARTSLLVAGGVSLLAAFFSLLLGCTAALFGGLYDRLVMRLVDVLLAVPPVIVAILLAAYLRPSTLLLILLLAFFFWPGGARVVRAQVLSLKARAHVDAARTFGAGWRHLLFYHLIPDLGPVVVAIVIQDARRAVLMEAGLSFLGLSDPLAVSWGKMVQQALRFFYLDAWKWCLVPPGVALSLTVTALGALGYTLERLLNPRLIKEENHA